MAGRELTAFREIASRESSTHSPTARRPPFALQRRADKATSPHEELLEEVWGYESDVVSRTVDTHIGQLRQKLECDPAAPQFILTVRKSGYRLRMATA